MIELYDAARLLPRRDLSLPALAAALLLALGGVGLYGWNLQARLLDADAQRAQLQQRLTQLRAQTAPSAALLADLQRQAERLESESLADPRQAAATGPLPSQWMLRLADLGSSDISLTRIDVDRGGAVRLEGLASSAQAVSRLLQHWDRTQSATSPVPARAIDVRQDAASAPLLSFKLRAAAPLPPPPAPTPRTRT